MTTSDSQYSSQAPEVPPRDELQLQQIPAHHYASIEEENYQTTSVHPEGTSGTRGQKHLRSPVSSPRLLKLVAKALGGQGLSFLCQDSGASLDFGGRGRRRPPPHSHTLSLPSFEVSAFELWVFPSALPIFLFSRQRSQVPLSNRRCQPGGTSATQVPVRVSPPSHCPLW